MLNSLPEEYSVVKNVLQYSGIVPTVELVTSGIKAREQELKVTKRSSNNLFAKGKPDRKDQNNNTEIQGFKGKNKNKKKGRKNREKKILQLKQTPEV